MFNAYVTLGFLISSVVPHIVDLLACFPFDLMVLSHYFLNMALLCFPERKPEMVPMSATPREVWLAECSEIISPECGHWWLYSVGSPGLRTSPREEEHPFKAWGVLSEGEIPGLNNFLRDLH